MRLSLCVIVRDEERLLPACLASAAAAVDEIVVVDTGSDDATVAVARAAGARVVAHAWTDSFADARNVAVRHARGEFVLVLDADERLAAAGRAALRAAVAADDLDAGFLPLHNAERVDAPEADVLAGGARRGEPVLLPRLLRRTPDLAWEGIVHEHVDAWLARPGRRVRAIAAPIVHLGYADELRAARDKSGRNRRLLARRCAVEPDAVRPRVELVRELLLAGDHAAAAAAADDAWARLLAAPRAEARANLVALGTLRAWLALHDGRPGDALAVLDRAAAEGASHPNLDLLRGHALELLALARGDRRVALLEQARACFARCLAHAGELSTETLSPGATSWSAATRLGTVLLLLGEPATAHDAFAFALAARGDHLEARLGLVEALLERGDAAAALDAVRPLLPVARLDGWLLAVSASHALGRTRETWTLLAQFRAYVQAGLVAPHRRARLEAVARLVATA